MQTNVSLQHSHLKKHNRKAYHAQNLIATVKVYIFSNDIFAKQSHEQIQSATTINKSLYVNKYLRLIHYLFELLQFLQ